MKSALELSKLELFKRRTSRKYTKILEKKNRVRTTLLIVTDAEIRLYLKQHTVFFNSMSPKDLAESLKVYDGITINNPLVCSHHKQSDIDKTVNDQILKENLYYELILNLIPDSEDLNAIQRIKHRNLHKKHLSPKFKSKLRSNKKLKTQGFSSKFADKYLLKKYKNINPKNEGNPISKSKNPADNDKVSKEKDKDTFTRSAFKHLSSKHGIDENLIKKSKLAIKNYPSITNKNEGPMTSKAKVVKHVSINEKPKFSYQKSNSIISKAQTQNCENYDISFSKVKSEDSVYTKSFYNSKVLSIDKKLHIAELFLTKKEKEERKIQANITKLKLIVNSIKNYSGQISVSNENSSSNNSFLNKYDLSPPKDDKERDIVFPVVKTPMTKKSNGTIVFNLDNETNGNALVTEEVITHSSNDVSNITALSTMKLLDKISTLSKHDKNDKSDKPDKQDEKAKSKFTNLQLQVSENKKDGSRKSIIQIKYSDSNISSYNRSEQNTQRSQTKQNENPSTNRDNQYSISLLNNGAIKVSKLYTEQYFKKPDKNMLKHSPTSPTRRTSYGYSTKVNYHGLLLRNQSEPKKATDVKNPKKYTKNLFTSHAKVDQYEIISEDKWMEEQSVISHQLSLELDVEDFKELNHSQNDIIFVNTKMMTDDLFDVLSNSDISHDLSFDY